MKKILTIAVLLISCGAFAQVIQPQGAPNVIFHNLGGGSWDSAVYLPNRDTNFIPIYPSCIIIRQADGLVYSWTGGPWKVVGSPVWGRITGLLTNQTDLYDSLQVRQRILTNGYGWFVSGGAGTFDSAHVRKVDTMYRVNDSTVGYKINGIPYTALIRGTAAGGISSLVLTVPTVLFSSPVTFTNSGGSWTGTIALQPQNANSFLAGPPSGSPANPTMRPIGIGDLPTGIPNANLANSTLGLSLDNTTSSVAFSASSVALGNTIVLHVPFASATVSGQLTSTDWNRFNAATTAIVTSVNGQVGAVITRNADTLGGYPIDFTNFHNGWVLAIDTVHSKLVFQAPGSGSGITTLNGLNPVTQFFQIGYTGTSFNISSATATHTFNIPIVNGADTGLVTPTLYSTWNGKEPAITPVNLPKYYWNGYKIFVPFNTDSIPQGSANLYFTNALARGALSITNNGPAGNFSYNNSTGVFNLNPKVDTIWRIPGKDSICFTINGRSYCILDSAGGGGGGSLGNPTLTVGLTAVSGSGTTGTYNNSSPALSQSIIPTWTGLHTFNGGITLGSSVGIATDNTYSIGTTSFALQKVWSRFVVSTGQLSLESNTGSSAGLYIGSNPAIVAAATGQGQFPYYTTPTTFTGTVTSIAAFDASGNLIQAPATTPLYPRQLLSPYSSGGNPVVDTIIRGGVIGTAFQNDSDYYNGFQWLIYGLPNEASVVTGDSLLVSSSTQSHKHAPILSIGNLLPAGSTVTTDPVTNLLSTNAKILHDPGSWGTTAALATNTYNNGTAGVGATITSNSNIALSIDGGSPAVNDVALINNEATQSHNGIYIVTQTGSGSAPFILTRTKYSSIAANMVAGSHIYIGKGTANTNTVWYQQTTGAITFGTTNLVYAKTAGTGGASAPSAGLVASNGTTLTNAVQGLNTQIMNDGGSTYIQANNYLPTSDTLWVGYLGQSQLLYALSAISQSDTVVNQKVFIWNNVGASGSFVVANPLNAPFPGISGSNIGCNAAWYFGKYLQQATGKVIMLCGFAKASQSISTFYIAGSGPQANLDSFYTYTARAAVQKYNVIIWWQGENDPGTGYSITGLAGGYMLTHDSLVANMRSQTFIPPMTPFLVGGMPKMAQGSTTDYHVIDTTLMHIGGGRDQRIIYFQTDSSQVNPGDIHYSNAGKKTAAYYMYLAYNTLLYYRAPPTFVKAVDFFAQTNDSSGNGAPSGQILAMNVHPYGTAEIDVQGSANAYKGRFGLGNPNAVLSPFLGSSYTPPSMSTTINTLGDTYISSEVNRPLSFYVNYNLQLRMLNGGMELYGTYFRLNNGTASAGNTFYYWGDVNNAKYYTAVANSTNNSSGAIASHYQMGNGTNGYIQAVDPFGRFTIGSPVFHDSAMLLVNPNATITQDGLKGVVEDLNYSKLNDATTAASTTITYFATSGEGNGLNFDTATASNSGIIHTYHFNRWIGAPINGNHVTILNPYSLGLLGNQYVGGSVMVGTLTIAPSAILKLNSTTQGFLPPVMNTTQQNAISSPATGLIIWNSDSLRLVEYNGSAWLKEAMFGDIGGGGMTNPMTTTGDMIYSISGSTPARLPIGTNGYILNVSSGIPAWSTALANGITATTQTAADNSTKVATTAYVDALHAVAGSWTPTVTTGTNVSAGSGNVCYYSRVGNIVTFSGTVNATITLAATASVLSISIPISSTFTAITDANGTIGANAALSLNPMNLIANTSSGNTMTINFGSGASTGGYILFFSGQYIIH